MLDYTKRSSGLPLFNWPVPTGGAGDGQLHVGREDRLAESLGGQVR